MAGRSKTFRTSGGKAAKKKLVYQQTGQAEDTAISLFSAASCYKQASRVNEAVASAEAALTLTGIEGSATEIRGFVHECSAPPGHRTLRGVVRNGTIHPFEANLLAEDELVTITTAG